MKTRYGWAFPDADEFMINEIKPDGGYQATHIIAALRFVTDWSVAVDCGAHVGTWSRTLASRFARVIAIEPSEDTFDALTENMRAFGCTNVELHRAAVGAVAGLVSMAPLEARAAAMKNTGARFVQDGGTIPRITIDSLQLQTLGFLKLDIEGSEALALEGARETLQRCRPVVLFENKGFWRHRYNQVKDAPQRVLANAGYVQVDVAGKDVIWRAA
jgi:FkbM family methyltransferase